MCGIAGFSCSPGSSFYGDKLEASRDSLSHRGPDDSGIYEDQNAGIGLVHTRLSILDLSELGHQPMQCLDGSVHIVFNGEIYNFIELRKDLESKGVVFQGHSDTEVLLQLYILEGEKMLSRLNGIFAFALYDKRKKALFVARDALGVKPFYYAAIKKCFIFASEIKGVLPYFSENSEIDIQSIHRYLRYLSCPGDGTPLLSIRKLGPGEAMWVKDGEIERRWQWYLLPIFRNLSSDIDKASAIKGVEENLREAVRRQMISDVPVGAFLSGGLDSSAIVALAREQNPGIQCFTINAIGGQEKGVIDDLPYAIKVAKHLGVQLHVVSIDSKSMALNLEQMIESMDEPIADPAALNVFYISQLARSQGIKVLLSGAGGDDLFTGYRRHRALVLERYWTWLPLQYRQYLENFSSGLDKRVPLFRRIHKLLSGASLSGHEHMVNYFSWAKDSELINLYTPEAKEILDINSMGNPMIEFLDRISPGHNPIDVMLALEQRFFLTDHNLNYTDKMSMAAGVEVRVPFLDLNLVEFAAGIPPEYKQRGKVGKWVLKKAMEPYLPPDIIYREKTGFGAPLRKWMRNELREMLGDFLSVESVKKRGLFDSKAIQKMISDNDSGRLDASYTLFSMLCLEIWSRKFIDCQKV